MKRKILIGAFLLLHVIGFVLADSKPTVDQVASKLSCYCGTCPHLVVTECGCGTAAKIKADVQKMIDAGMTSDQIVKSYVDRYGETVLAAPPKRGFSLAAWLFPFVGFVAGLTLLAFFLKKQEGPAVEKTVSVAEDDPYRKQLEDELEQIK